MVGFAVALFSACAQTESDYSITNQCDESIDIQTLSLQGDTRILRPGESLDLIAVSPGEDLLIEVRAEGAEQGTPMQVENLVVQGTDCPS